MTSEQTTAVLCGTCKDQAGVICDLCGNGLVPDDERRVPFRRPPADYALPDAVGLCPDHGGEFYMPLELPLNTPFVRCPVGGCDRNLILYSRAGR